nr:PepSY domain-containing protein [Bradyrhizobium uaiense]
MIVNGGEIRVRVILSAVLAASVLALTGSAAFADGYKTCTKLDKASWKPASDAEAKAKAAGYEVRRSKVEGTCYEVYGVKEGKLYELFYSPEDLSLKHTIAK